jgi:hypothetical protein
MGHLRYQLAKNERNPYWSVNDIFTGQPVVINGVTSDRLTAEEADDMVDLLNLRDLKRRSALKHP